MLNIWYIQELHNLYICQSLQHSDWHIFFSILKIEKVLPDEHNVISKTFLSIVIMVTNETYTFMIEQKPNFYILLEEFAYLIN